MHCDGCSQLIKQDVEGLKRVGRLATKYMGKQHGWGAALHCTVLYCTVLYCRWGGGTLLSISSSTELSPGLEREPGQCTVLGTTRALGLAPGVARSVHTRAKNEGSQSWRRTLLEPSS